VKFSFRQILASAAGAVIAALIASSFGVTGTIVGVAIGSMAATLGTALVAQSIERGQKAVKQVVVRVPDGPASTLLRRVGGTGAAGGATSSLDGGPQEPEPTEVVGAVGEETARMESSGAAVDATDTTRSTETPASDTAFETPVTDYLEATTAAMPPTAVVPGAGVAGVTGAEGVARAAVAADVGTGPRRFTWKAFAATAAIVFVLALGFVTAVELIADKPLASIFGTTGNGPTLRNIFTPGPPATTTTTTPASSTTSTSTAASTTTTTTTPSTTTTSTTTPGSTTTSTSSPKATTTTTTTTAP
jgi:hypothetical protein